MQNEMIETSLNYHDIFSEMESAMLTPDTKGPSHHCLLNR